MPLLFDDDKGFCLWCKQGTAFSLVQEVDYASPVYGPWNYSQDFEIPERVGLKVYKCLHCDRSTVVLEQGARYMDGSSVDGNLTRKIIHPEQTPRALDEAAPSEVAGLFAEASKCENAGSMRGAGVMYRATVEALVKDQGATGGDLFKKIDSLKGKVSEDLVADLHEARMLGNDSIHAGLVYSAEEVADVAALIEEAVLELYVQPNEKRKWREARKQRRSAAGR